MLNNDSTVISVPLLIKKKRNKQKIVALTAYDYPTARILDEAGVDIILVGDSLGMVVLGYETTIPVTMEEMLHHTKSVRRAVKRALVVADMPYFSFHLSLEQSMANASSFIKEGGAHAVKIEGASKKRIELIEALIEAEIPVMGHVGLTPQSIRHFGRYGVKGKEPEEAKKILNDALRLEKAGVFSVVIESVPMELARLVTEKLSVPTIGIGAGSFCDGQILVFHDLVGYSNGYTPKFVKKYADLENVIKTAVSDYSRDVREGRFPDDEFSYHLKSDGWLEKLKEKNRNK
ncbi:MAG: 3-methyl-2-oxobutanoate hydroxymethyltransferase [Acidobacteriota bacterium]